MSEAMVVRALTSFGISREVIAKEFGVSGALIGQIRAGNRHKRVRPDLVRLRALHPLGGDAMHVGILRAL